MKLVLLLILFGSALAFASAQAVAQEGCVTQTLSLLVYYEDASETAANINQNILPPPPMEEPGDNMTEAPPPPAPEPVPPGAPVDCPTLVLPASAPRAQTACKMADDLPGARCIRLWSGLTLVIEPLD
jgi:hypothetical protein